MAQPLDPRLWKGVSFNRYPGYGNSQAQHGGQQWGKPILFWAVVESSHVGGSCVGCLWGLRAVTIEHCARVGQKSLKFLRQSAKISQS